MTTGLTSEGFVKKTFQEIRQQIINKLRSRFGENVDVDDDSVNGILIALVAEQLAIDWEQAEGVVAGFDVDQADEPRIDSLSAYTGTVRRSAQHSTVVLTLTGADGTVVVSGREASDPDTETRWETLEDAEIVEVNAWAASTSYVIGDRVTNDDNVYVCVVGGTSGSSGPTGEGSEIEDGDVTWRFVGEGEGAVDVDGQAVEVGPIAGLSGTITEIETPESGWEGVINLEDATPGRTREQTPDLRERREDEIGAPGKSTFSAILSDLLSVDGVDTVQLFTNRTAFEDSDGMPPHSIEAVVKGGDDQSIFDTLLDAVAAGIQTHGSEEGSAEDDAGNFHTMRFSRPVEVDVYVAVTLQMDPDTYSGDEAVKEEIATRGNTRGLGRDVVASRIVADIFKGADGIIDVESVYISTSPNPDNSDTIEIAPRELANYDTSRVEVTSNAAD